MSWQARREGWNDERVAAEYDAHRFRTPLQRRKHGNDAGIVLGLLARAGRDLRVLDAPTGTGRMLPELESAGHRAVGLDLSVPMLRQAAAASGGRVGCLCGEIERLPFAEGSFDAVIVLRFLFHVRDAAVRRRLLEEYGRVATWLIVHERSSATWKHLARRLRSSIGLAQRYRPSPSPAELAGELSSCGWTVERATPVSRLFSDKVLLLARWTGPRA